jgi:hypothetical protein
MDKFKDWGTERAVRIRQLEDSTGESLESWNLRIQDEGFEDEQSLRSWLNGQCVTGYSQSVLVMENFGYPDFFLATADQLIEEQYADRPALRPIFEALLQAAVELGELTVQARKTYVSLVTPRRTFARLQPTTKTRLDLGLRLEGMEPGGRLKPSKIHETMKLQVSLSAPEQVDAEVLGWLRRAYEENC